MKTLILVITTVAMLTSAEARERYRSRHRVWAAPLVGGLIIGGLGYYGYERYSYRPRCWTEFAGYDHRGNEVYDQVCH